MKRSALLLASVIVGGCAAGPRAGGSPPLAGWSGPPPRVTVMLAGSGASSDGQRRCDEALARAGAIVDSNAGAQAIVTLDGGRARLQVLTRRGLVRDEPRPAWPVERLCDDALAALATALRGETAPPADPAVAQEATSTPYQGMPQPARQHDSSSNASGGVYLSPIQ